MATTFAGFCNYHDTTIFKEIDFGKYNSFDPNNKRQMVLLPLRAVAREYWLKLNIDKDYSILADYGIKKNLNKIMEILNVDKNNAKQIIDNIDEMILPYLLGTKELHSTSVEIAKSNFTSSRYSK